jgi:hypothetical protein
MNGKGVGFCAQAWAPLPYAPYASQGQAAARRRVFRSYMFIHVMCIIFLKYCACFVLLFFSFVV